MTATSHRLRALLGAACGLALLATPAFANAPFGAEQVITALGSPNGVAVGELDDAHGGDVFYTASGSSTQGVALRQSDGSWSTQALTPGAQTANLAIADLDGDGDRDLVYTENGGAVLWRENDLDGTGAFLAPVTLATGIGGALGLDVADLDGDDDLDVVVAGRTADGYFWIDNTAGDASAWTRRTIATGVNAAQKVVAADLDGDGDLDIAGGSSSGSGKLAWYENANGDGSTWLGRDIYSSRIAAVAAGDLDLDGDIDLLVQDTAVDDILWWENVHGDGTSWTQAMISSFPAARNGLQVADLDFDGDLDVVGDPNGDWWENVDEASSWTRRSYSDGTDVFDTGVLDVDVDGDLDIVAVRNAVGQVSWWPNLTCSPGDADDDSDGVRNGCDVCAGFDDAQDADGDLVPDGCDTCPGFDDRVDVNDDGVPDACEPTASIAIDNVTANEGDAGTTPFTFTVTLTGDVPGGFTVPYSTQDQTATVANSDYVATAGTLTFAGTDGEQQAVTVQVLGDPRVENSDAFLVVLGAPSNTGVSVDDDTGVGTLVNDDTASLAIDNPSTLEGDTGTTGLTFTVTLTGAVDGGFDVDVDTEDFAATVADGDYVASSATLTFAGVDGEQQTFTAQVVGDTVVEPDEAFNAQVRNPMRPGVVVDAGRGFGTITNDDTASLVASDVTRAEGDAGTVDFDFTVTLAGTVAGGFDVPHTTVDGSATSASGDYTATSGTLTFAGTDGESQTVTVTVAGDVALEADETFTIDLGMPSKPSITTTDGTGTITNDDAASIAIDDVTGLETDAGTTFTFTVTLTGEVADGFTVPFSTADGTATVASGDYDAAAGTVTFAGTDGETKTIDITVNGDTVVEPDETFTVELDSPSNPEVTVTDASGLGTILNDDSGAQLVVTKSVSSFEPPYDTVVYVIEISNVGDGVQRDDPTSNELEDLLPDELTILDATSDNPTFQVTIDPVANALYGDGMLASGDTVIVTLEAAVDAAPGRDIANQALVRYDTDGDGTNDATALSDDPSTPAPDDATVLPLLGVAEIPTLGGWGLVALTLLLSLAALRLVRRPRAS